MDVGQPPGLAADVARDARGEVDLRECVDARIQHELGALLGRPLALTVEVADEDGREQDEPEHDAGVARGDRDAAVDRGRRPPRERGLGERAEREREPGADQQLRRERPGPARARQQAERGDAARAEQRARRPRACAGWRRAARTAPR